MNSTTPTIAQTTLLAATGVRKTFTMPDGSARLVLDDVSLSIQEGEIVTLLGRSGSGKSTLLRIIAGLVPASGGDVRYRGQPVLGPVRGMSMVFQSFALFPWLTVLQNVELGLEALGVSRAERRRRALEAIDLIGLDGFESAYPRELSGGMRQRVGFARALVVEPDLLLMDEPFSALDVLTAETLRSDLLELWLPRRIPTKGILFVSHNIEEAVLLADRVLILSSNPGRIAVAREVRLSHPRDRDSLQFRAIVEELYALMTQRPVRAEAQELEQLVEAGIGYHLPDAPVGRIEGLLEVLVADPYDGRADLPELAEEEHLSSAQLFPLLEAAEVLGFARVREGDVEMTAKGKAFIEAGILRRKEIFREQLAHRVSLAIHIRRLLEARPDGRVKEEQVLSDLGNVVGAEEARRILDVAIEWGRYAELFAFDDVTGVLSLDDGAPH